MLLILSEREQSSVHRLLTATPEQLGKAGHYARLRLLDPARSAEDKHALLRRVAVSEQRAGADRELARDLDGERTQAVGRQRFLDVAGILRHQLGGKVVPQFVTDDSIDRSIDAIGDKR